MWKIDVDKTQASDVKLLPVIKISQAAAALGRLGGIAKSKKKAETARVNGKKGGRPRSKKKAKAATA